MKITRPLRHRPRTAEGTVLFGVTVLLLLEALGLALAPAGDRPAVGGALTGAGAAVFIVFALVLPSRRRAARHPVHGPYAVDGDWFSSAALEGFPMDHVRPWLLGPDAPDLNRLYIAWVLATHGYTASWIAGRLDLRPSIAHTLVDAARWHPHRRPSTQRAPGDNR